MSALYLAYHDLRQIAGIPLRTRYLYLSFLLFNKYINFP